MNPSVSKIIIGLMVTSLAACMSQAAVMVTGVNTTVDAAYASDVSNSDLVNSGSSTLTTVNLSAPPGASSPTAHNNGAVGTVGNSGEITFWLDATVGQTYSITYNLSTITNTLGYDITSIQTIHGWNNNSGYQKNQNYEVFVSTVGSAGFTSIGSVAYNPFTTAITTASTKVNITENASGVLAFGIDQIRFTYTITGGGPQPGPTIREIDVFGVASVPEPKAALLGGLGLLALLRRRR